MTAQRAPAQPHMQRMSISVVFKNSLVILVMSWLGSAPASWVR